MAVAEGSTPKLFSLRVHQSTQNENDIMVTQQGSDLQTGDVVEIYKDEADKSSSHVLLKITLNDETFKGNDTVSIMDTICNSNHFNFKIFNQVFVRKVTPEPVDLVVLTCKDTYLSRSDMWRMKQHLEDTCVYIDKRVSYVGIKMQISISEIWSKGENLACGYISHNTRMSAEMWEYDSYGDLYFEKAVSGFLTDLFDKWQNAECGHDVTIVIFSRTFYEARQLEDFPEFMRDSVQRYSEDRFYEDFYRVVIKNERYDDWKGTLVKMKQLFINYEGKVLRVEEREQDPTIPKAYNSSAAQGNYLEVLNMSLNLFEKYYLDRNFDRLGKMAMVITAGPGVFEVDRDLMSVTKQRTIDTGCSADLICMGEQPLHTVPLFKYREPGSQMEVTKIPKGWINHSFYTSQSQMRVTSTAQFVPRIKVASKKTEQELMEKDNTRPPDFTEIHEDDESDGEIDYDAYDRNVFKSTLRRGRSALLLKKLIRPRTRNHSEEISEMQSNFDMKRQSSTSNNLDRFDTQADRELRMPFSHDSSRNDENEHSFNVGSAERHDNVMNLSSTAPGYKMVDPFNPNSVTKPSANRRRWVHAFPIDRFGTSIQPHHIYVDDPRLPVSSHKLLISGNPRMKLAKRVSSDSRMMRHSSVMSFDGGIRSEYAHSLEENSTLSPHSYKIGSAHQELFIKTDHSSTDTAFTRRWDHDSTEFSAITKTGVDWRSLTTPALLPITTDYYPDEQHFIKSYKDQVYMLDPLYDSPMSSAEFFKELVSTRLALGFQVIQSIATDHSRESSESGPGSLTQISTINRSRAKNSSDKQTYRLSVGKVFHQLSLQDGSIIVRVQQPQKTVQEGEIQYKYQFMNPDSEEYGVSITKFAIEQLERYKWNLLDNYVINRGLKEDDSVDLLQTHENMKYWCSRFCLLPANNNAQIKRIKDKAQNDSAPFCDTFKTVPENDYSKYIEGFIRFLELVNCIKRKIHQRSGNTNMPRSASQEEMTRGGNIDEKHFDLVGLDMKKLLEQMKDASSGLSFLDSKSTGLPAGTFISYEAVVWVRQSCPHVRDNAGALMVLQKLLEDKSIEHISQGHNQDQFLCGFHLYCVTSMRSASPLIQQDAQDEFYFNKDWVEVSLAVMADDLDPPTAPSASQCQRQESNPSIQQRQNSLYSPAHPPLTDANGYKSSDIDAHFGQGVKNELKRVEWITLKYHCFYHPCCGFDFELDWIVATGGLLSEMISSWSRMVGRLGFHLLPIPVDPFALPTEKNSDPLRGPIFVPLDPEFANGVQNDELVNFMGYLIDKFGFIPIVHDYKGTSDPSATQFIHCTGGFFILIQKRGSSNDVTSSAKAGFHWSWNFMMTKQWWSPSSGDEMFEDTMLEDFRLMSSNHEGRLTKHWNEWVTK